MRIALSENIYDASIEKKSTRQGFGDGIVSVADSNKNVMALTADFRDSVKLTAFAKKYPKRFIDTGIAEQNLIGVATGLALSGKIPFAASIASFNPGRNWEQIRVSVCYTNANVKVVGTHSGLSDGPDGATHQSLEDIALTRILPNMTVIAPCDYEQTIKATEALAKHKGPAYLRITRTPTPVFTTPKTDFVIGKAQILKTGNSLTVIAYGPGVYEVLLAARELSIKYKIDIEVVNCHTIKPLDEEAILKSAKKTHKVVTVEEHQIAGGLGGAVAELLSEKFPVQLVRLGMNDSFGESGTYENLLDKYELSKKHLVNKFRKLLS